MVYKIKTIMLFLFVTFKNNMIVASVSVYFKTISGKRNRLLVNLFLFPSIRKVKFVDQDLNSFSDE